MSYQNRQQGGGQPQRSREDFFKKARKKVQVAISSRDNLMIQSVSAVDELNKASNLLFERLTEWYGMHFPEFKTQDNKKYVQGVLLLDKDNIDMPELEKTFGPQAQSIAERMKNSVGTKLSADDISQVRALAAQIDSMWKLRDKIEKYEAEIAVELCPNMSEVCGPELTAKLVAQAGGLQRLSTFPSSTVQVLGAEKALFKHLKSGSKPPKHGLIFQHPLVGKSPKKLRGKIARLLAGKLTIAAKADAITHNSIGAMLKKQFEDKAKRILESVPMQQQ